MKSAKRKLAVVDSELNSTQTDEGHEQSSIASIINNIALDFEKDVAEIQETQLIPSMLRVYHSLNDVERVDVTQFTSDLLKKKFGHNQAFKNQIYKFISVAGSHKDWQHMQNFVERLLTPPIEKGFMIKTCQTLFEIIDEEIAENDRETVASGACLALMTEIGIQILNRTEAKSSSGARLNNHVIEFLTSNLLARSNINNETMRVGILYFLTKIEKNTNLSLQKILSRFGENLLNQVFQIYFSKNEKSETAFYFLVHNLTHFLTISPALAEMSNDVLQSQMLKHPSLFLQFLTRYLDVVPKDSDTVYSLIIHMSFLLKQACEINQEKLAQGLFELIVSCISVFQFTSRDLFLKQYETMVDIVLKSHTVLAKQIAGFVTSKILNNKSVKSHKDVLTLMKANGSAVPPLMTGKLEQEPNPLEEIRVLAG